MRFWNPTNKQLEFKYNSRTYVLKPSDGSDADSFMESSTRIPGDEFSSARMAAHCLRDFKHLGLVVVKEGDDIEVKKREGMLAYYESVWRQLVNWNSFKDDKRNNGQTIIGEYPRVKELKKELFELESTLGLENRLEDESPQLNGVDAELKKEFLQFLEFKKSQQKSDSFSVEPKRRGRPANVNAVAVEAEG